MMKNPTTKNQSKVLVCFNCRFYKTLKHEAAALIIIRNHNERRDGSDRHILRTLDKDELKPVDSLPYYDGDMFRAFCTCGEILSRKTEAGIQYAMAQHELFNYEPRTKEVNHSFYDYETYTETIVYPHSGNKHEVKHEKEIFKVQKMKRKDYIAKSKNPDIKFQESMALYNLKPEDLNNESTAITTYDPNIFWNNNETHSFNAINNYIWTYIRCYNCPACGDRVQWSTTGYGYDYPDKQYSTFKELYWHYYREHYIQGHNFDDIQRVKKEIEEHKHSIFYDHGEELELLKNQLKRLLKSDESNLNYRDTIISMLQQMVMVELSIHSQAGKKPQAVKFNHDRGSNALYQLNRMHGISMDDLRLLFFPNTTGRKQLGEKLFHGMVWTENKAPNWLDKVIEQFGEELGI